MFGGRMDAPMFVRLVIGRSWGQGAQHSQSLQALFAHIPGLTVIMPSSADMIVESYPYFISQYPGPVISLEHRLMYDLKFRHHDAPKRGEGFPRSSVLARTGSDVTIVATSIMVLESLRAAEHLKREAGIDCEVIDLHCVSHPDKRMILESVQKTGKLLVADTSWREYGVGAEVSRIVAEAAPASLSAPVVTMGMQPAPCPTAKSLEDLYYPNLTTLTDAVAGLARGRRDHGIPLPDEHSMADVYKKFKGPF
jgi:pyruvate dehydrogenase E1 component beta subunit